MSRSADRAPVRKLVILAQYYWPEVIGSAPYCTDLAEWFASRGVQVTVIAARPSYPSPADFADWADGSRDRERRNGVAIQRVPVASRRGSSFVGRLSGDGIFAAAAAWQLATAGYGRGCALASFVPSVLSVLAARFARRGSNPLLAVVHDIESGLASSLGISGRGPIVGGMRAIERFALRRADTVVVLSDAMRREMAGLGLESTVRVLPIWVAPCAPAEPVDDGRFTIMYSGSLGKKQNLDYLVPLVRHHAAPDSPVRFVFQGDGPERAKLAQQVATTGSGHVSFRSLVPSDQLAASLQSASLHVIPQATGVAAYAIPSKVFSVMAAGRPFVAIADASSPLSDIAVESGGGLCVPPGDEPALLDAVRRLIDDPALCRALGARGSSYVQASMAREAVLAGYAKLLFPAGLGAPSPSRNA